MKNARPSPFGRRFLPLSAFRSVRASPCRFVLPCVGAMPSIKRLNYTINPCGCVEGNDISTSCLLRRSTFCFSATVKALHVLEVSSAVSRIDSSRRNGSAGDTPHEMRVLRGSETQKLHAEKAAEEGFFTCSKGSMRHATSAQLRLLPVDCILLATSCSDRGVSRTMAGSRDPT